MKESKRSWKRRGCLIASLTLVAALVFIAYGLKKVLTPWHLSEKDPREMFELFVCKPIPGSVRNIEASGVMSIASSGAYITFEISPEDVDLVIDRGEFREFSGHLPDWVRDFSPATGESISSRLFRVDHFGHDVLLFISEDRKKCWFVEVFDNT